MNSLLTQEGVMTVGARSLIECTETTFASVLGTMLPSSGSHFERTTENLVVYLSRIDRRTELSKESDLKYKTFGRESTGVTHETGKDGKYVGNPRSLVLTCTLSSCMDSQQMLAKILALKSHILPSRCHVGIDTISLKRLEGFVVTKM